MKWKVFRDIEGGMRVGFSFSSPHSSVYPDTHVCVTDVPVLAGIARGVACNCTQSCIAQWVTESVLVVILFTFSFQQLTDNRARSFGSKGNRKFELYLQDRNCKLYSWILGEWILGKCVFQRKTEKWMNTHVGSYRNMEFIAKY